MTLVGLGLLIVGGLTIWRTARTGAAFRDGPWPGLSPAGALMLLGCALVLAGGQLVVGDPHSPVPDLPLLAVLAVGPIALATRLVGAPGVASAVCGAYLLPRALLSVVDPTIEPPPLLLVPALAFDVSAWLRAGDVANLAYALPGGRSRGRRRHQPEPRSPRRAAPGISQSRPDVTPGVTLSGLRVTPGVTLGVTPRLYAGGGRRGTAGPRVVAGWRAAVAGAVFGGVLVLVEPPFALLLGGDPAAWSGPSLWQAGGLSALGCAMVALAVTGRGTAT